MTALPLTPLKRGILGNDKHPLAFKGGAMALAIDLIPFFELSALAQEGTQHDALIPKTRPPGL
ncbi:hypothetical protein [Pontibacter korlensis]|uniref:hypothetical protein n=1 Tax=Pontibacter korlensis TaxID=400092 RepID=UPI000B0D6EC4|nr:hypothetical protein [Pontibacter korlensis]